MRAVKCERGHFYDGDRYVSCPHCAEGIVPEDSLRIKNVESGIQKTEILSHPEMRQEDSVHVAQTVLLRPAEQEAGFGSRNMAVAWLVGMDGAGYGKSYELTSSELFDPVQKTVALGVAPDISENVKEALLISYGKESNVFYVSAVGGNVVCVAGKAITGQQMLQTGQLISVGKEKYMFVELCGEKFSWTRMARE